MVDTLLCIAGTSYSGSTLLSFLLNAHPRMVSVGEETGPVRASGRGAYPCSCGRPIAHCRFWRRVSYRMGACGIEFGPDQWDVRYELGQGGLARRLLSRSLRIRFIDDLRDAASQAMPPFRSRIELNARNAALVRVILEMTGKKVFVSAAKNPLRVRHLDRIPDLDVKVLHLVRDAPAFVSSAMTNRRLSSPARPIRYWNGNARQIEQLQKTFSADRHLRVRYEDLCSDVAGQLARIAEFMDLPPMTGPIRFRAAEHHIVGNRMRLSESADVVLDEKWRARLPPELSKRIEHATRVYRRRFGYAPLA
jgi:hypothetical protein